MNSTTAKSLLTATVAAVALALTGCGSGGSPDAGGGGSTSTPTAGGTPSSGVAPVKEQAPTSEATPSSDGGGYQDPAEDMPRFKDAADLTAQPGFAGYWEPDYGTCAPEDMTTGADHDPVSGQRVTYTELECYTNQTEEFVTVRVWDATPEKARMMARAVEDCGMEDYGVLCMPGNGWYIYATNEHTFDEVLDVLGVDNPTAG